jgi:hypothetical protein
MGSSFSLPRLNSLLISFGGVGGPECRLGTYDVSFGGVGGRSSLAVPESFGGVGGGRPWEWSREGGCSVCVSWCERGGAGNPNPILLSVLLPLLPPVLEDSAASSTTGSVVPNSPRSADGLRTLCIWRLGTLSSEAPRCRDRSA